jgi:hypothetical protein
LEPAGTHALTAQEAEEWNAEVANTIRDLNTQQRLRDFGQKVIDPTNQAGGWFFQKYVLPIADNAGLLASFSIPRAWPLMLGIRAQAHQEEQYQRLVNEGWDELDPATNRTALLIGLGQSALDEGFGKILEGLPELSGTLKNFALTGGAGSRLLYNTGKTAVGGTIFSLVQGQLVPAALQDVLASNPQFKPDWGRVWSDTAKAIPDTFAGMLLLAAAGATFQTRGQAQRRAIVEELSRSPATMRLLGYMPEQIGQIQSAESLGEKDALLSKWANQAPPPAGPERDALVSKVQDTLRDQQELFEAKTAIQGMRRMYSGNASVQAI